MKAPAISAPPRTLLDKVRRTGLADELLLEVEVRVAKKRQRRRALKRSLVTTAALIAFGFWAVPYFKDTSTVATRSAHRETLALSDGSIADLNASTDVRTDFRYGRRLVHLDQGEAFFSVAKDSAHPFLVETPAGTIRVTGTRFNVRLPDGHHAEVTLLEGSVLTEAPAIEPVKLAPGQQVVLDGAQPVIRTLSADDLANVTAWRRGQLVFDGLTLGEAVARFAAYHGTRIEVDPKVAGLHPGGTCPLDDLPQFLEALKATKSVQVLALGDGSYRIVAR
jgi:transmembrane sensor